MRPEDVPGGISLEVGHLLRSFASHVPLGQVIVEIGAFKGRSTCFLASGAREGVPVISIEPHGLKGATLGAKKQYADPKVREAYLKNIEHYPAVRHIRSISQKAPLPKEPVGLLWIDGDHTYEGALADIKRFGPLVARGGIMIIDDYNPRWHSGVIEAVNETRLKDSSWRDWSFDLRPLAWARKIL